MKRRRTASERGDLTIEKFEAMSPQEKERVYRSVDREIPLSETRPLTREERKVWERFRKRIGRPKVGKGAKVVAVSVERERLEQINSFIKQRGLGRSELFLRGVELAMKEIERKERRAS